MNNKMSTEDLINHILDFLKENREGALGTCFNNNPRSSPVQYFVGEGMNIYIVSAGGEKFKALAQNPNVCLLVNTNYIDYRQIKGVQVFGKATTSMENPTLLDEARKYCLDLDKFDYREEDLKIIKIEPVEIVYLDSLGDGDRTKQILKGEDVILKEDERLIYH